MITIYKINNAVIHVISNSRDLNKYSHYLPVRFILVELQVVPASKVKTLTVRVDGRRDASCQLSKCVVFGRLAL